MKCKVCDSENIKEDKIVVGRQRFKCQECDALFFEEGEAFMVGAKLVPKDQTIKNPPAPPSKGTKKPHFDKYQAEILSDYANMPVVDLERKWGMGKSGWYRLKFRWENEGVIIPTAFADRNTPDAIYERPSPKEPIIDDKKCGAGKTDAPSIHIKDFLDTESKRITSDFINNSKYEPFEGWCSYFPDEFIKFLISVQSASGNHQSGWFKAQTRAFAALAEFIKLKYNEAWQAQEEYERH